MGIGQDWRLFDCAENSLEFQGVILKIGGSCGHRITEDPCPGKIPLHPWLTHHKALVASPVSTPCNRWLKP